MALLSLSDIRLSFGGHPLLDGINLTLESGDRYCLIGRNGEGKTTLMRIIEGAIQADSGDIGRKQGMVVSSVQQDIPTALSGTVFSLVAGGRGKTAELLEQFHALSALLGEKDGHNDANMKALERIHEQMEAVDAWSLEEEVEQVMSILELDGSLEFTSLSGGNKRRVLLARALISKPDLLLLDEPTNHLDIATILWLEEFLLAQKCALVFVTHDRAFARRIATRVGEIDRGQLYSFNCGYDVFIERRDELLEAEAKKMKEFGKTLAQEEVWIRRGVKARRVRDEGRVKALIEMRKIWANKRERTGTATIKALDSKRSGDLVLTCENLSFAYGPKVIVQGLTTSLERGERLGIMGINGAGKTTLIKLLLGQLQPDSGTVRQGSNLQILYFDQLRDGLSPKDTVFDSIAGGDDTVLVDGRSRHVNAYLQDFLFSPDRARSPVSILSGGERNRLLLAKLFTQASNVLVLDEPTNDLDAETLDLLEGLLLAYKGTVILVSHDRDFMDQVATSTLVIEGEGRVEEFAGGYSDWLVQKASVTASAKAAVAPKGAAPGANASTTGATAAVTAAQPAPKTKKLSFKEQKELEELPARIAALELEQKQLHEQLADPGLHKASGAAKTTISARLSTIEKELKLAYARWEELEGS